MHGRPRPTCAPRRSRSPRRRAAFPNPFVHLPFRPPAQSALQQHSRPDGDEQQQPFQPPQQPWQHPYLPPPSERHSSPPLHSRPQPPAHSFQAPPRRPPRRPRRRAFRPPQEQSRPPQEQPLPHPTSFQRQFGGGVLGGPTSPSSARRRRRRPRGKGLAGESRGSQIASSAGPGMSGQAPSESLGGSQYAPVQASAGSQHQQNGDQTDQLQPDVPQPPRGRIRGRRRRGATCPPDEEMARQLVGLLRWANWRRMGRRVVRLVHRRTGKSGTDFGVYPFRLPQGNAQG